MTGEAPNAKNRTPLLLLHGALGSGAQMLPLADLFRGQRTVFAPDFPGHGQAADDDRGGQARQAGQAGQAGIAVDGESKFSIDLFSDAICGFLDQHGIENADIFGYSMGGYVALHVARHHPGRVGRIVTLGTKFAWDEATAEKESLRLDPATIERKVPAFAAQLRERHGGAWQRVVRSTAGMMLDLGANPALTKADLRSIPHRVLVAVGDRDAMVTVDETIGAARSLPAGECLVLPGTPHPFEQVDTELLAYHVRHFISKE